MALDIDVDPSDLGYDRHITMSFEDMLEEAEANRKINKERKRREEGGHMYEEGSRGMLRDDESSRDEET